MKFRAYLCQALLIGILLHAGWLCNDHGQYQEYPKAKEQKGDHFERLVGFAEPKIPGNKK